MTPGTALRHIACAAWAMVVLGTLLGATPAGAADDPRRVAPYAPTGHAVSEAMLDLARVGPADHVVDLGSGDGRIVIAAARRGATGLGVDIDAKLVESAQHNAAQAGVEQRVRFVRQDLFETDLAQATVVTLYLFPAVMGRVAAKLAASLAPGTRVVSHDFPLPGWRVERITSLDAPDKYDATGIGSATLYLYIVPADAATRAGPR